MSATRWTRRAMIGSGAAALAAVVLGAEGASAADSVPTWALDPTPSDTCKTGCTSCAACVHHGANKMFKSQADAYAHRAHPGCNCLVVPGQPLTGAVAAQLFAGGPVADRRRPQTARLLAGQVEQHSVPMVGGAAGLGALAVGGAGVLWVVSHRHRGAAPLSRGEAVRG